MNKKYFTKLIFLLLATLLVGGLLILVITYTYDDINLDDVRNIKSESLYVIVSMVLLLFFFLVYILHTLRKKARILKRTLKRNEKRKIKELKKARKKNENIKGKIKQIKREEKLKRKVVRINIDFKEGNDLVNNNSKSTKDIITILPSKEEGRNNTNLTNNDELVSSESLTDNRFYMLSEIDTKLDKLTNITYNNIITLEQFCNDFREYAAHTLKLYYDIEDIRRFVASLAVTNIIILQGMSGTGKTSLAYAFGEFVDNQSTVVPVQPMWKERTDLIGYYNEFTKKFNETVLLQKLYEANYSKSMYITVLDEMNIARIEYYFAEFLSLLELPDYKKRNLDVISNKWETDPKLLNNGQITLPYNMWFVGTANNDDSTFAISDKVYDRAMVLNLDKKAIPFTVEESTNQRITANKFYELVSESQITYSMTDRNYRRIKELDKYLIKNFQVTFGNRIMHQIRSYIPVLVATGGTEEQAIDDILSKKVLRKLEAKNLAYVKASAPALVSFMDELFGEDVLIQCKNYVLHIERNV